jgi:hypothetical protein
MVLNTKREILRWYGQPFREGINNLKYWIQMLPHEL